MPPTRRTRTKAICSSSPTWSTRSTSRRPRRERASRDSLAGVLIRKALDVTQTRRRRAATNEFRLLRPQDHVLVTRRVVIPQIGDRADLYREQVEPAHLRLPTQR